MQLSHQQTLFAQATGCIEDLGVMISQWNDATLQ